MKLIKLRRGLRWNKKVMLYWSGRILYLVMAHGVASARRRKSFVWDLKCDSWDQVLDLNISVASLFWKKTLLFMFEGLG